jgi:hypothetical protein
MRDCKIAWKVRLLEEWLPNWEANVPQRWLDEWENGVPETWLKKFQETVPEGWAGKLVETHDAISDVFIQIQQSCIEELKKKKKSDGKPESLKKKNKSDGKSEPNKVLNLLDESYNTFSDFKKDKSWVEQHLTGRKTCKPGAMPNKKRKNQVALCWEDFIPKAIDILLEKEPQIRAGLEINGPQFDPEEVYSWITWQMNILDSFIPSAYKAELHGRNQPFPEWRELIDEAMELHLNGKRHWNREEYPDIRHQIEATASSLVFHANEKVKKVLQRDADCKHKLGGSIFSQKMGEVEDERVVKETSPVGLFDNEVDNEQNTIRLGSDENVFEETSPVELDEEPNIIRLGSDDSDDLLRYEMSHGDEQMVSQDGEVSELCQKIDKAVKNDPELVRMVECLLEHELPPYNPNSKKFLFKTQEVANALGCSVNDVNNLRRRLERKLTPIFAEKVRRVIQNNVGDDPRLTAMVNFIFDQKLYQLKSKAFIFKLKPDKIASRLRWTVLEVNKLKEELQNRLETFNIQKRLEIFNLKVVEFE